MSVTVVSTLLKPFGKPFKVSSKGDTKAKLTLTPAVGVPLIVLLALYLPTIIYALAHALWYPSRSVFVLAIGWSVYSMVLLWLSLQASLDVPQLSTSTRFKHRLPAAIRQRGIATPVVTEEISDIDISVRCDPRILAGTGHTLSIPAAGLHEIPVSLLEREGETRFFRLLGAREIRRSYESTQICAGLPFAAQRRARETKVDHLNKRPFLPSLCGGDDHHVRGLDVAMNQMLPLGCIQRPCNLRGDLQREDRRHRPMTLHQFFRRVSLDEFHGKKEMLTITAEVVNRRDVPVSDPRRGARFAHKGIPPRLSVEAVRVNDLQCDGALQIYIASLEGDAHGAAPQFPAGAVINALFVFG